MFIENGRCLTGTHMSELWVCANESPERGTIGIGIQNDGAMNWAEFTPQSVEHIFTDWLTYRQCHLSAHETKQSMDNLVQRIKAAEAERDAALACAEKAEKETEYLRHNMRVAESERDGAIEDRDVWVAERDAALARVAALEAERDNLPDVTERALEEANYHRSANEFLTANLNRATEERDAALARVNRARTLIQQLTGWSDEVVEGAIDHGGAPMSVGPGDLCE